MSSPNSEEERLAKRIKTDDKDPQKPQPYFAEAAAALQPRTFVTWNVNGFMTRCQYNRHDMRTLVQQTDADIICLQEVRIKAASPTNRGTPLGSEYHNTALRSVLESSSASDAAVFDDYEKYWSLADSRYAGTLTLLHKRLALSTITNRTAFSTHSAIDLLLQTHNIKRNEVELEAQHMEKTGKNSNAPKKQQTTIASFFKPKTTIGSSKSTSNNQQHHPEGRFQFFVFRDFDFLQVYAPNNGSNQESFTRRKNWDCDLLAFLKNRRAILAKAGSQTKDRPLLWCGDLNVARDHRDGTHWEQRTVIDKDNENNNNEEKGLSTSRLIYEWWTDESKCFVSAQAKKLDPNRAPGDKGMPSFTPNERTRFALLLEVGDLVDIWRCLHPRGTQETGGILVDNKYKTKWDRPDWTWRGHMGKAGNTYTNKYQGKGQRLDYFLLSPSSALTSSSSATSTGLVESCDILGYGEERLGFFCGSDHCAVVLKLHTPLGNTS